MSDDHDLARIIEPLARHFFGEPNRKLSTKINLRFGTHGSMSVDLAKGVWHDHETASGGGVLDLIDREKGLRGKDALQWLESEGLVDPAPKPNGAGSKGRIVATYNYVDACGKLVFQAVRYEPKQFKQRRPDGADGWIWKLDGVKPIPYRLPELVDAISHERVIFIVEGEKDVDRLWSLGVPATCNAMGAGKWTPEHSAWFEGADDVVIVPDIDPQSAIRKPTSRCFTTTAAPSSRPGSRASRRSRSETAREARPRPRSQSDMARGSDRRVISAIGSTPVTRPTSFMLRSSACPTGPRRRPAMASIMTRPTAATRRSAKRQRLSSSSSQAS